MEEKQLVKDKIQALSVLAEELYDCAHKMYDMDLLFSMKIERLEKYVSGIGCTLDDLMESLKEQELAPFYQVTIEDDELVFEAI